MATELKYFNITTDKDMFYLLTWKSKVMGRFVSYKQATAHKLYMQCHMTSEGKCKQKSRRKADAPTE